MKTKSVTTCYTCATILVAICCKHASSNMDFLKAAFASDHIVCPGQPLENFCDCAGDCTGQPEWCACEKAQECCHGATPTVLCPGQPKGNYCDCDGDCQNQPSWCSCDEAQVCCGADIASSSSSEDSTTVDTTDFLKPAFRRFSGSNGTMDRGEWNVFVRHLDLIPSCNGGGDTPPAMENHTVCDTIWFEVLDGSEPFFSFDRFLVALGKVALDRRADGRDRNTEYDVYEWVARNHADEERYFCRNESGEKGASGGFHVSDRYVYDLIKWEAFVFLWGLLLGSSIVYFAMRRNTVDHSFTEVKSLQ